MRVLTNNDWFQQVNVTAHGFFPRPLMGITYNFLIRTTSSLF